MLYISLGSNCYVSWLLRKIGFQHKSYPFDWINTSSISSIPVLLVNGFAFAIKNWKNSDFVDDLKLGALNNKYLVRDLSLRFPHEYDVDPEINLQDIVNRYERRFVRMSSSAAENQVVFIRNVEIGYGDYPSEDSISYLNGERLLYQSLSDFCGHTNFVVLFFSRSKVFDYHPSFENFYIIRGCVPFENGFYKFNHAFVVGQPIFDFYQIFFEKFKVIFDCNAFPSVDQVKKMYDNGRNSVVSNH